MKKLNHILIPALAMISFWSCTEDILDIENEQSYNAETFFANAETFNEGVIGIYSTLYHQAGYARELPLFIDFMGLDAEPNSALSGDGRELADYTFNSNSPFVNQLWRLYYRMMLRSNLILSEIEDWEPETSSDVNLKDQFIGEASFFRAYAIFSLIQYFGRAPIHLTYLSHSENTQPFRATFEQMWTVVESDLETAIQNLPLEYNDTNKGRITRGAAVAQLGKAHLYQEDWLNAITQFEALTQPPYRYSLENDLDNLFIETAAQTSDETIFEVKHGEVSGNFNYMFGGQERWGGATTHNGKNMELGGLNWNNGRVEPAVIQAHLYQDETGNPYIDPRAFKNYYADSTQSVANGGDTDYCNTCDSVRAWTSSQVSYRKYMLYESTPPEGMRPQSSINHQVIRYADVLLMLAEAYIETNRTGDALPLINQVRARSGAFEYTTLGDATEATEKLRRERRIEFFSEQLYYHDMRRWDTFESEIGPTVQARLGINPVGPRHRYLPIPQSEIDTNPNIEYFDFAGWN